MERTPAQDVDWDTCPCCGVAVTGDWLADVGACELCAGYPYTNADACWKAHGDPLRLKLLDKVERGAISALEAAARAAIDDAHRAGKLRERQRGYTWIREIVEPAPDPNAWERLSRMRTVDRTIREAVEMFVGGKATQSWEPGAFRKVLVARLSFLSRHAGCAGIWRVEVASPTQIDIQPPDDYISPDTPATQRRATIDGLVREALIT